MLSESQRREIVEALRENPNAKAVATEIGNVSHATVWRIAKACGVELASATNRRRQKAVQLKSDQLSIDCSSFTDIIPTKVQPYQRRQAEVEKRNATVLEALKRNSNAKAVAQELGNISHTTVARIARNNHVFLADGKRASGHRVAKLRL